MGKTGYFTHRECWRHEMGPGHPECPARLDAIEDRLLVTGVADALERHEAPRPRWPISNWPMTACMWLRCRA